MSLRIYVLCDMIESDIEIVNRIIFDGLLAF